MAGDENPKGRQLRTIARALWPYLIEIPEFRESILQIVKATQGQSAPGGKKSMTYWEYIQTEQGKREAPYRAQCLEPGHRERLRMLFPNYPRENDSRLKLAGWYRNEGFGDNISAALAKCREFLDPLILLEISKDDFLDLGQECRLSTGSWQKVQAWREKPEIIALLSKLESQG